MTTSQTRRNRRRKAASAAVAVGASAALLAATTLTAPPAQAAIVPTIPLVSSGCDAGESPAVGGQLGPTADCTQSSPAVVAAVGDWLIGVLGLDVLPFTLADLNSAGVFVPGSSATIKGNGFATALAGGVPVVANGTAVADAQNFLSAAIALAATGGTAKATSNIFGAAAAVSVGATFLVPAKANANALPGGIAIAINNLTANTADATALGGVAMATTTLVDAKAVCTAMYASASVATSSGSNLDSCTSLLFIFQKQQTAGQHDGYEIYAIKNPFALGLVSPVSDTIAGAIASALGAIGVPGGVADVLAGRVVPEFQSDIVRIVMDPAGPRFETDLPDWLESLFGQTQTNSLLPLAAAATDDTAPTVLSVADKAGEAEEAQADVTSKSTAESVTDAGIVVNDPAPLPPVETPELADPPAMEVVDQTPQDSPQPEAADTESPSSVEPSAEPVQEAEAESAADPEPALS